jgi:putative membrane protein
MSTALTQADLDALAAACREAEAKTGAEVVVYAVRRCDPYAESRWRVAALVAVAAVLGVALARFGHPGWHGADALLLWSVPSLVAGFLAGWLLGGWGPVVRRLASEEIDRIVELRAAAAFVEEEVFDTRDRTGVLLFVALFEHRFVILADAGIRKRVAEGVWDEIVHDTVHGFREGRGREALLAAVRRVGDLLADEGVPRREDDVNELADAPRIRDV